MTETVLILGGSGRFGRNCTKAFEAAGWHVRQFDRKTDDLMRAVQGVDVIVAGWNPAYPDWEKQVAGQHASIIRAARSVDATVIVPGNVYVYGAGNAGEWRTTTPHLAQNPLGRIRIDMEAAYRNSGVRTILLRAGDYIDTQASGNWFDMILTTKLSKGVFRYPGWTDIPHAWAYLPDVARAAAELASRRDDLNQFEEVAFGGYTLRGQDMADVLSEVCGKDLRVKQVNWLLFRLLFPFWKMAGCLLEMRYLWNTPHSLANDRFQTLLPDFVGTPVLTALRRAVPDQAYSRDIPSTATSTQTSL